MKCVLHLSVSKIAAAPSPSPPPTTSPPKRFPCQDEGGPRPWGLLATRRLLQRRRGTGRVGTQQSPGSTAQFSGLSFTQVLLVQERAALRFLTRSHHLCFPLFFLPGSLFPLFRMILGEQAFIGLLCLSR